MKNNKLRKKILENILGNYLGAKMEQIENRELGKVRTQYGHWKNSENVKKEIKKIAERLGHFPSQKELFKLGHSGMLDAVYNYHGGLISMRKELGFSLETVESGKWKDRAYTVKQVEQVMKLHKRETLPTQRELDKLGYSSLSQAISKYHGGFNRFRSILGEESRREKHGVWKDIDFVKKEARKVVEENALGYLPDSKKLKELGYISLANAISRYHGGFHSFRISLGEQQRYLEEGLLKDRNYVLKQLHKIMKKRKLKTVPSSSELRKWGYGSLGQAVYSYHGGFVKLRNSLGESPRKEKDGSWKDLEFTIRKVEEFLRDNQEYKTLPSYQTLYEKGHVSLGAAIQRYHGGFPVFRQVLYQRLGIQTNSQKNKLEGIVDSYIGYGNG